MSRISVLLMKSWISVCPKMRKYRIRLTSADTTKQRINSNDCVIVGPKHGQFDYYPMRKNAKGIVDTSGVYRHDPEGVVQT